MSDLAYRSATDIADAVRSGERTPTAVTDAFLDRIHAASELNAFVTVLDDRARERAREVEERLAAGAEVGPLAGVPVAIKDLSEPIEGVPNTKGMAPLADNVADRTGLTVERLEAAGAIVVGTTNTPELGHTPRTYNELVGPTPTPFDPEGRYNAGGSSGGSAAALAAGLVPLATGSDVGGSLRVPASCCGVTSVKPTFGLIPNVNRPNAFEAHTPFAVLGPMARTVEDVALMLSVVTGRDDRDPFSVAVDADYPAAAADPLTDASVAYSPDLGVFSVEPAVEETVESALSALEGHGATIEEITFDAPDWNELVRAYGVSATVMFAATAHALEREHDLDFAGVDADRVSETFVQTLALGQGHDAVDYRTTDELRTVLYDAVETALSGNDVLVCPTLATPPLEHHEPFPTEIAGEQRRGLPMDWMLAWPFNMTGHPVVNVPAGLVDGLPVGLQVVGRRFDEETCLRVAAAFETAAPWHDAYPGE